MDIYSHKELEEQLLEHYLGGGGKTFYCGFKSLAPHYSVHEGGRTDWTGYPGSGKTELLLEVLNNCSEYYGHKHLIHMPDAGSVAEIIAKIMHKMSGKQMKEFYYDKEGNKVVIQDRLTQDEIKILLPKVMNNFVIFKPSGKASKAVTPKEYWNFASENKKLLGIFSAVIDSWNYMNHDVPSNLRYDQWLESTLSFANDLAEQSKLHLHTIIHPKSPVKKDGKVQIPDMHELKGGSEWGNNGKSIIVVHREFDSNITDIKINKAKPEVVGVRGFTNLFYDVKVGRFYEINGITKKYAQELTRVDEVLKETKNEFKPLEANKEFDDGLPF
jgi:hypothetical protein